MMFNPHQKPNIYNSRQCGCFQFPLRPTIDKHKPPAIILVERLNFVANSSLYFIAEQQVTVRSSTSKNGSGRGETHMVSA